MTAATKAVHLQTKTFNLVASLPQVQSSKKLTWTQEN